MKRLLPIVLLASQLLTTPATAATPESWTRAVEPVRIAGNLYYVGSEELGAYALVGKEGTILLDAPMEENAEALLASLRKIGVKPKQVRILLNSHAHFDHAGGFAKIKKATKARLYLSPGDAELMARGGRDDFAFGDRFPFPPVKADALLTDNQTIRLGDVSMTALFTPGHTRGCTSWRTTVVENQKPLDVVIVCSLTAPGYQLVKNEKYPEIMEDYRRSIERLRKLDPDIFLSNHASFFDLQKKREGQASFVQKGELARHLDWAWGRLQEQAQKQRE
ncbi:MAG TPA: subclass B3 metallo-beta-lactamase [Thermoanaerobaculia bacterium]|jgi:metallo-beta-lactamase class B